MNELPIHECFHVADRVDVGQEVSEEEPAARVEHAKEHRGQAACGGVVEIVVQSGGVDQVEPSRLEPAGDEGGDPGRDERDAGSGVGS